MDAVATRDPGMRRAATFAMGVGLAGALGAAVTGLTDWSETDGQSEARRTHSRFAECDGDSALRNGVRASAEGLRTSAAARVPGRPTRLPWVPPISAATWCIGNVSV